MRERVVQGACGRVVLLGEPVDAASAGFIGERVDGLDEAAADVLAAPPLGDVKIFQIAAWPGGPCRGMHDHVRQSNQLMMIMLRDESVDC